MKNSLPNFRRPALLALLAATLLPACGDSSSGGAPAAAGAEDLAVPSITVSSPTSEEVYEVNASPVDLAGTAADAIGLVSVAWTNSTTGATGSASGLTAWTASVWLAPGPNTITFTATDGAGNTAKDKITVILRAYSLRGWGKNNRGQLGDGTLYDRNRPVTLPYLQGVKQVACGLNHTAVLLTDGTLRVWGDSTAGQVGSLAPSATNPTPVAVTDSDPVLDLKNIVQIACTDSMTVALDASGIVWYWGGFDYDTDAPAGALPWQLNGYPWSQNFGITNVKAVAAGSDHIMMLLSDGTVAVSGRNDYGQFGEPFFYPPGPGFHYGYYPSILGPAAFGGRSARSIHAGGDSCGVITDDGQLYVWGRNDLNQLGILASPVNMPTPAAGGFQDWNSVSFSSTHGAGIRAGSNLYTWGDNAQGQLGLGSTTASPTPSFITSGFSSISAGVSCTVVVLTDGQVRTAGINAVGTLGTGSAMANSTTFQTVSGLTGIVQADIGAEHIVALKGDSPVIGFGLDFDGQLGTDRSISTSVATSPIGVSTAIEVAAGTTQTLIRLADGSAVGFGFNFSGEVGDGTTSAQATAVPVDLTPPPSETIAQLSGTQGFSLARLTDGSVWAWGDNGNGQLGFPGANTPFPTMIAPPPSMAPVSFIATGGSHALAVGAGGTVWGWGTNYDGQLGRSPVFEVAGIGNGIQTSFQLSATADVDGSNALVYLNAVQQPAFSFWVSSGGQINFSVAPPLGAVVSAIYGLTAGTTPAAVPGITGAVAVAGGSSHSLALLGDGSVLAWGDNSKGQLGDGTTTSRYVPLPVTTLSGVIAIAAGGDFSLALLSNGTIRAWGSNAEGQLGTGNRIDSPVPVQVGFLTGVTAIAAGGTHGLALLSDQTVRAWGGNEFGQIGDSTLTDALFPTDVLSVRGVVQISAGFLHSMAVLRDGSVRGWGGNIYGNLGDGTLVVRTRPVAAVGFPATSGNNAFGAAAFAAGGNHSAALLSLGKLRTWGQNVWDEDNGEGGQLGDGTIISKAKAGTSNAGGIGTAVQVACGQRFTLCLTSAQTIFSTGDNSDSQLGRTTTPATFATSFSNVVGLPTGVIRIGAGRDFAMAVGRTGSLIFWGSDNYGQSGDGTSGTNLLTPTNVPPFPGTGAVPYIIDVACGQDHALALSSTGAVYAWGNNNYQQVINDLITYQFETPQTVPIPVPVKALAGGRGHSLALDQNGNVWTWGDNEEGQLGRATGGLPDGTPAVASFAGTTGNLKAIAIACGEEYSVALLADGSVWTCGVNATGQLGLGDTLSRSVFTLVPGVTGVINIAAGRQHTLLRK